MTAFARLAAACLGTAAAIRTSADPKLAPRINQNIESDAERRKRSTAASTSDNRSDDEKKQHRHRQRRRRRDLLFTTVFFLSFPAAYPSNATIQSKKVIKSLPPGTKLRPPPPRGKEDSVSVAADAATVRRLTSEAREASEQKDWSSARALYLEAFSFFAPSRGEDRRIASAEIARIHAALSLVELGEPERALLELEDALAEGTPALRGSGEIHAALAALRYSLRRKGAESELGEATALEPRWGDERWVEEKARVEKGWPPSMVSRLVRFLQLD